MIIEIKKVIPLNSHQAGIRVKNKILEELEKK